MQKNIRPQGFFEMSIGIFSEFRAVFKNPRQWRN